jgi:hypothetical protein
VDGSEPRRRLRKRPRLNKAYDGGDVEFMVGKEGRRRKRGYSLTGLCARNGSEHSTRALSFQERDARALRDTRRGSVKSSSVSSPSKLPAGLRFELG